MIKAGQIPPAKTGHHNFFNRIQRALLLDMADTNFGKGEASRTIGDILGNYFPPSTAGRLLRKAREISTSEDRIRFLQGNQAETYRGPSDEAVKALVVYEYDYGRNATNALLHLHAVFPEHVDFFDIVKVNVWLLT
jgi:hypothetical protein